MSDPMMRVFEDIQRRLALLEGEKNELNRFEIPVANLIGSGLANRLAAWVDERTVGISYGLTTVGDLIHMAADGANDQVVYFANDNISWPEGTLETIKETFRFTNPPKAGSTVSILIDFYSGYSVGGFGIIWRIRKNDLAGTVLTTHVASGTNAHADHWAETVVDATPGQTYVLTSQTTVAGTGLSDYRSIILDMVSADPIPARLPIGSEDQFLRVASGLPVWESVSVLTSVSDTASVDLTQTGSVLSAAVIPGGVDHNQLMNYASNRHFLQTDITNVSTALATGLVTVVNGTGALGSTANNTSNWDTAYGWGNHASAGYALATRTITEGAGLAGNTYDLSANRTLAMGTPSTLTVSTTNSASGTTHTHAITSSSAPGAAASLLASNASGYLRLIRLGIATDPAAALHLGGTGGTAAEGIEFGTDAYFYRVSAGVLRSYATQLQVYPISANATGIFRVIPNGSPASTRTTIQIFNTDFVADSANYETGQLRFASNNFYDINSSNVGSGTLRPIQFSMNSSQIGVWNTNGGLQIIGIADRLQLLVKNNATQTTNPIEIQSSSSAQMAYITPTGGAVFNESGDAAGDVRMESDTEVNMFLLDANGNTNGQIFLGGSTNGIQIDKGGELTLIGTATVWDDLRVEPTVRGTAGAKTPSFDNVFGGLYLYSFNDASAASEKEVFFNIQLPHTWKEGSTISPHVHWINETAGTAGHVVRWGLEYSKAVIGGTFSTTATTIYGTTIVGGGDITVANEHMITEIDDITMSGDTISTILICRLFRNSSNAADTYTGTAGLLSIDIHVEIDGMGSKDEFTA